MLRIAPLPLLVLALCPFVAASPAPAQTVATPNLTGTWVLSVAKSDFGAPQLALANRRDEILHQGTSLKVHRTQEVGPGNSAAFDFAYAIDGSEHTNDAGGQRVVSILHWEGRVLVMTSKVTTDAAVVDVVDRYQMSEDGRTLTVARHLALPEAEMSQTLVFEKA